MTDSIARLCKWYESQCVNDWHEEFGVRIDTIDNPGWSLKIDLKGTNHSEREFIEVSYEKSERDWLVCRRNGDLYEAYGGPFNLDEMIEIFVSWVNDE